MKIRLSPISLFKQFVSILNNVCALCFCCRDERWNSLLLSLQVSLNFSRVDIFATGWGGYAGFPVVLGQSCSSRLGSLALPSNVRAESAADFSSCYLLMHYSSCILRIAGIFFMLFTPASRLMAKLWRTGDSSQPQQHSLFLSINVSTVSSYSLRSKIDDFNLYKSGCIYIRNMSGYTNFYINGNHLFWNGERTWRKTTGGRVVVLW